MTHPAAKLYNDILAFVETSKQYLDEGREVELAGLDGRVNELCRAVIALPPAEAKGFADNLQHLLNEIGVLGDRLELQRSQIKQGLEALNLHQKANVAYKTSDMMAGTKPPTDKKE